MQLVRDQCDASNCWVPRIATTLFCACIYQWRFANSSVSSMYLVPIRDKFSSQETFNKSILDLAIKRRIFVFHFIFFSIRYGFSSDFAEIQQSEFRNRFLRIVLEQSRRQGSKTMNERIPIYRSHECGIRQPSLRLSLRFTWLLMSAAGGYSVDKARHVK